MFLRKLFNNRRTGLIESVRKIQESKRELKGVKITEELIADPKDFELTKQLMYYARIFNNKEIFANFETKERRDLKKFLKDIKLLNYDDRILKMSIGLLVWLISYDIIRRLGDSDQMDDAYSIIRGKGYHQTQKNLAERFSDIKGCDEAIEEIKEITDYLMNPDKYISMGIEVPKGILLTGPPGVGKTLLARALAGETSCSFYYSSGSSFDEMIVGLGSKRIRKMFEAARENAPCIIFIDEIDSLGGRRNANGGSHQRQALNQLLTEMDGFKKSDRVIVIAATNMEEMIDPALKRSGRFDKVVRMSSPDIKGRTDLFNLYLSKIKVAPNINVKDLVKRSIGFSGADIANLINTAAIRAGKSNKSHIEYDDLEFAFDRVVMGVRRKLADFDYRKGEKRDIAIKEIGETAIALMSGRKLDVYKVTLHPSGDIMGYTALTPSEDQTSQGKLDIIDIIDINLGGRVAEEVFLGEGMISTNSASKVKRASDVAYNYVRQYGMADDFAILSADNKELSDEFNYRVEQRVERLLEERSKKVKEWLVKNKIVFNEMVEELISKETLTQDDLLKYKHMLRK